MRNYHILRRNNRKCTFKNKIFNYKHFFFDYSVDRKNFDFFAHYNVKEIADIKTIKQIKNSFGGGIAYSISIYNYGNMPAKNVVIKDKIESTSSNFNIKIGSKNLSSSDYALTSNYLQIPSYTSKYSISVPEAQFIKDDTSGKFGIIPGTTEINIDYKV